MTSLKYLWGKWWPSDEWGPDKDQCGEERGRCTVREMGEWVERPITWQWMADCACACLVCQWEWDPNRGSERERVFKANKDRGTALWVGDIHRKAFLWSAHQTLREHVVGPTSPTDKLCHSLVLSIVCFFLLLLLPPQSYYKSNQCMLFFFLCIISICFLF